MTTDMKETTEYKGSSVIPADDLTRDSYNDTSGMQSTE